MKKNKFSLEKLFYNNKVVLIISVMLSFIFWFHLSTGSSEVSAKTVTDIPITVNLSETAKENGLSVFGIDEIKAQVTVSGNRLVMGQLNKNDIQIVAYQAPNLINTTGNYTLELVAKKNSYLSDYEFTSSVSPNFITINVDRLKEKEFTIKNGIRYSAEPKYFVKPVSLSYSSVIVSGPESRVLEISEVIAEGGIKKIITETVQLKGINLILYDARGNRIIPSNMKFNINTVDATITVLSRKQVKLVPDIYGVPDGFNIIQKIKINPNQIEIAGPEDVLKNIGEIKLAPLNFSKVSIKNNKFKLPVVLPAGCINLSGIDIVDLEFSFIGLSMKSFVVNEIVFVNVPQGKTATSNTKKLNVDVIGPVDKIKVLSSGNIAAKVDLNDNPDLVGQTEMNAKIVFNNKFKGWAHGEYRVNVVVS